MAPGVCHAQWRFLCRSFYVMLLLGAPPVPLDWNNAWEVILLLFSDEMALKESEIRVLVILGLIILILWAFFGLFWSLLLVFTFLIYAYNFGRQQNASSSRPGATVEDEPDVTLYQEQLPNDPPEFQDLPFTCLQKGQFTLRSPMPLLSDVTKRLSFNTR